MCPVLAWQRCSENCAHGMTARLDPSFRADRGRAVALGKCEIVRIAWAGDAVEP